MKHQKILFQTISEYFQIAFGIVMSCIGLNAFLLPNGFLDGGITGIAILLNTQFSLNISILLIVLSLPFLILAYFALSKGIVLKSIISTIALAILLQVGTFETITDDKLLISIFGGIFMGTGIGICIRNGAVMDGAEVLGIYLNDRFGISIGRIILVFNVVLFSITAILVSVEIALYSILTYIVTAKVTDYFIEGFEDFIGFMIVSVHHQEIKQAILTELGAGMTIYNGEKGYGSHGEATEVKIIHTIINRIDIRKLHRIIEKVDEEAFVVEFDVNNIKGGVLRRYLNRSKERQLATSIFSD